MRTLLCDADIPEPLVNALVALKIPAMSIKRIPGAAGDDMKVVEIAHTLDAIIVALDRDYTANLPLYAAMVHEGSRVVRLRPAKCAPTEVMEQLAKMFLDNYRIWQEKLNSVAGVVSCTPNGNRLRELKDFPWYKKLT